MKGCLKGLTPHYCSLIMLWKSQVVFKSSLLQIRQKKAFKLRQKGFWTRQVNGYLMGLIPHECSLMLIYDDLGITNYNQISAWELQVIIKSVLISSKEIFDKLDT